MWFSGQIEVSRILKTPLRYFRITISENLKFLKRWILSIVQSIRVFGQNFSKQTDIGVQLLD